MSSYVSDEVRGRIRELDHGRCAYCLTSEANTGMPLTIDHIQPVSKGGATHIENLCLACRPCNEYKAAAVAFLDPLTGEPVQLFHPRRQLWKEHFSWSVDGARVEGRTACGRATVLALHLNHAAIVAARTRWCLVGWHPPAE